MIQDALRDKEMMNSLSDKKLYITVYGNLISSEFKMRVENDGNIDIIFRDLCRKIEEKSSTK
jgi:hypothetical protein